MATAPSKACPTNELHPSIPRTLPVKIGNRYIPSRYDSTYLPHGLTLQQRRNDLLEWVLVFEVVEPIHLHVDMTYDFALHSLDLRLQPAKPRQRDSVAPNDGDLISDEDQTHVVHSMIGENRRILHVHGLQNGWWGLVVRQTSAVAFSPFYTGAVWCADFAFKFDAVAEMGHLPIYPTPLLQIPHSLDVVGLSRDGGWARLFGDFPAVIDFPRSNSITFAVKTDSLFRVHVAPNDLDIDLYLSRSKFDRETNTSISVDIAQANKVEGEEIILENIPEGKYELKIMYLPGANGLMPNNTEYIPYNIDIAVAPITFVKQMNQVFALNGCPVSTVPPIDVSSGEYQWFAADLTQPAELSVQTMDVHIIPFGLTAQSIVFVEVGFEFLSSALAVRIESKRQSKPLVGFNHGNVNQIHANMSAGTYELIVYQPHPVLASLAHCLHYSLNIRIISSKKPLIVQPPKQTPQTIPTTPISQPPPTSQPQPSKVATKKCGFGQQLQPDGSCKCASGHLEDLSTGTIRCLTPESCQSLLCHSHGLCDRTQSKFGIPVCVCQKGYTGSQCEICDEGFVGYPKCIRRKACSECLNGGRCDDATGVCVCPPAFSGDQCQQGLTGDLGEGRTVQIVRYLGLFIAAGVIVLAALKFVFGWRSDGTRTGYALVGTVDLDEQDDEYSSGYYNPANSKAAANRSNKSKSREVRQFV
eukprot:c8956_g1_i1.p1 GENE.c8956_g1_i1~~c8956_g1_i1.p1  ORF type:complete len:813 (+),score=199.92 c8956_g1_i1:346-2439(+)